MNILFIYSTTKTITRSKPLQGQEDIYLGVSYISSILKQSGHQTQLAILDRRYGINNYKTIDSKFESFNPDMVCFTSVFSEFEFICSISRYIKTNYPKTLAVIGGVHVSINPKEGYLDIFDIICIGEGEYPLIELANNIENNKPYTDIQNFWVKSNGKIIKNNPRPFIENISLLPFPDREIWKEWILKSNSRFTVLLGRGCPFNCTYCCNHKIRKISSGKYVRLRDVEDIISELKQIAKDFPSVDEFFLEVETCGIDTNWLVSLCNALFLFNCQFKVPKRFSTNLRVFPNIKEEIIFQALQKANFYAVSIGLESGNERVRREVLNREYSNNDIRRVVATARKYGIKIGLYNLVGLPGESHAEFLDTLALNQELQPDWHATSIFFPYEGTVLYDKAKELGVLPKHLDFNFERQRAVLDLPRFSKKQIQREFDSFHYNVYRKTKEKSIIKLLFYFIQKFLGHNFMAQVKIGLLRLSVLIK
ncbi:MAG TPA: hypothetical protein DIW31_02745 [Bacteroidales bacterium]|nr:hypothetical protein [Bacteroidales bacterium]